MRFNKVKFVLIVLFLIFFINPSFSQKWSDKHWGLQVGISANLGSHTTRFGLKIQGYYTNEFFQINAGNHIRFNAQGLGGRKDYVTQRLNAGIVLMGGKRTIHPHLILDGLNHQTNYEYALAYNYLWYLDNAESSQRAGGFGLHVQQFSLYIENDILAGRGKDRFRTGFAGIGYHNENFNLMFNTLLWTGETGGVVRTKNNDPRYPGGYKDISTLPYGKTSHGIISLSLDYSIFFGNVISASVGMDSERVRNGLQNKFMHNKVFLPKAWRKENPHYPMLNKEGTPAKSVNDIRPPLFYFQAGLNRSLSY